ncbi:MAG: FtsX-like permease family protein [Dermatophilaceae bacterium]
MLRLAWSNLTSANRRLIAPVLAVALGVGFVAATFIAMATMSSSIVRVVADDLRGYDVVVTANGPGADGRGGDLLTPAQLAAMSSTPGVRRVDPQLEVHLQARNGAAGAPVVAATAPRSDRWVVTSGVGTVDGVGVLVSDDLAQSLGLRVGRSLELSLPVGGTASVQVLGIGHVSGISEAGRLYAANALLATWTAPPSYTAAYVLTDGDPVAVAAALGSAGGKAGPVLRAETTQQYADRLVQDLSRGTDVLGGVLMAFAGVALFVSCLVIGNTFTILMAQRARQVALLRCLGATRRQVARAALIEATLVGVVASVVGVLLGIGVVALMLEAARRIWSLDAYLGSMTVPTHALVIPVVIGTLATVVAALVPVRRGAAVSPLAALRPEAALTVRSRSGALRLVLGLLLFVAGTGAMVIGVRRLDLALAMPAGMLSFVGVLMVAPWYIPAVARAVGWVLRRFGGPTVSLAVGNSVRNPRRAAATASALLVGTTLITLMTVGAASARVAAFAAVDRGFPVDIAVAGLASVPADVARQVAAVPGVAKVAPARVASVEVRAGSQSLPVQVIQVDAAVRSVLRLPAELGPVSVGTVVITPDLAAELGVADGGRVQLGDGRHTVEVTVRTAEVTSGTAYVAPATFDRLGVEAMATLFVALRDGADAAVAVQEVTRIAAPAGLQVEGAAQMREAVTTVLNVMLSVVVALLAISVLIAVIGIANTLSLSVLERSRESAILRALGLTRAQLRRTFAIEAVLLGGVAAVVGLLLGVGYGYAGARTILGSVVRTVPLEVPWGQLGLLVLAACLAGLLASVLPGRRAAMTPPVAALAAE